MPGLWRYREELGAPEGKYLLVRRDGTIPTWPFFAIGAADPCAKAGLLAYADKAEELGIDQDYVDDIRRMAEEFEEFRLATRTSDPSHGPEREDHDTTVKFMKPGRSA